MSWHRQYDSKQSFEDDKPSSTSKDISSLTLAVARDQVLKIIASGVVGDITKDFRVYLSGHENPNHEPKAGWANDCITVTVSQK